MHLYNGLSAALTLTVAIFWTGSAHGQKGGATSTFPPVGQIVQQQAVQKLKPGSWVRYSIVDLRTGRSSEIRLLALEYEGKGQWLEVTLRAQGNQALIYKSLMALDAKGLARPLKMIVQAPGQRPMLIPTDSKSKTSPLDQADYGQGKVLGRGKLKVRAGSFQGRRMRKKFKGTVYEAWISDAKGGPAWPLLRVASKGAILELIAFGRQGSSKVVGKPVRVSKGMLEQLGLGTVLP
jgi:hypothetical protein